MMNSNIKCTYEYFEVSVNKCQLAKDYCLSGRYFNLMVFHFCTLEEKLYYTLPIFILLIFLSFYMLSSTANKYLSSSLTIISDKFGLSQNISAMTLLAFGNGAPDVISSIVASGNNSVEGLGLSIGALLGSGMVITTIVFSLVICFSKNGVKVIPKMFIRECVFYLFSLIILCLFALDGVIYIWESCLFIGIYFINLLAALYIEKSRRNEIKNKDPQKKALTHSTINEFNETASSSSNESEDSNNDDNMYESRDRKQTQIYNLEITVEDIALIANKGSIFRKHTDEDLLENNYTEMNIEALSDLVDERKKTLTVIKQSNKKENKNNIKNLAKNPGILFRIKRHYFNILDEFSNLSTLKQIIYIIELPFLIIRDLSIPAVEEKKYNKYIFVLFPILSCLAVITLMNLWTIVLSKWYIITIIAIVAIIFTFILIATCFKDNLPKHILLFCFLNFAISVVWIWASSNLLVDILNFIGITFNIPRPFLGLTLLAIGNSAPDTSLNCSLAKNGYGEMAVAGTFAGPLFNLLIGLGVSLLQQTIRLGKVEINFFDRKNIVNLIGFGLLFLNILSMLIISKITKFHLNRVCALVATLIFITYLVLISVVTFN